MKLYMFRTVLLPIIRSLFTVHSAMVYVIQTGTQFSSRTTMEFGCRLFFSTNFVIPYCRLCYVLWCLYTDISFASLTLTLTFNPFSASPPHRTYARSARLILRKLLVLRKIVLLTTNKKKESYIFFYITNRSRSTHPLALLCLYL